MSTPDFTLRSKDKSILAEFYEEGEIRFGPMFYTLSVSGHAIKNRYFGLEFELDETEQFLAVQEWMTQSEAKGPRTQIAVFDLKNMKEAVAFPEQPKLLTPDFKNDNIICGELKKRVSDITFWKALS